MMEDPGNTPGQPQFQPAGRKWPALLGALTFLGSFAAGILLTILVIRAIPPKVAHPTEAYEGVGDAMMATYYLGIGAFLSFSVAFYLAIKIADLAGRPVAEVLMQKPRHRDHCESPRRLDAEVDEDIKDSTRYIP
jgi:hypothetical protein